MLSASFNKTTTQRKHIMKITILAPGSRGDVQPYIALGKGLQAADYAVTIATHALFEAFVRSAGLGFSLIQVNPKALLESDAGQAMVEQGRHPFRSFWHLLQSVKPLLWEVCDDCWQACQGADAIIFHSLLISAAASMAEKLGVPAIAAGLQPIEPTGDFPCLLITNRQMGRIANQLTYQMLWRGGWLTFRPFVNAWRRERLHLPPFGWNMPAQWKTAKLPVLYGVSPLVVPRPSDWNARVTMTGYWILETETDWQAPAELARFLAAGTPPVYIGFGSMRTRQPERTTAIVIEALQRANQRGILLTGWGALRQTDVPASILMIESAPHEWLFPRMAAVVHHGGAGTTAAALHAGVPSLIIPFMVDQPFWGKRVADLGVGVPPIPQQQLTVERLSAAITAAVSDPVMRQRAADLGARLRAENGVANAVAALNRVLKK